MTETTINVPEINCEQCKSAIEGALRPLPGVVSADVNVAAKTVHVTFDDRVNLHTVRQTIEGQGYEVPGG